MDGSAWLAQPNNHTLAPAGGALRAHKSHTPRSHWPPAGKPGFYKAVLITRTTDEKGHVKKSLDYEFGSVFSLDGETVNEWASQPVSEGLPKKTTTTNILQGTAEIPLKPNTCL